MIISIFEFVNSETIKIFYESLKVLNHESEPIFEESHLGGDTLYFFSVFLFVFQALLLFIAV
jgi:hypothetical protein